MWLIAVALPIQGVAAATMLHCGATHEHRQVTSTSVVHVHEQMGMHSEANAGEGHVHHHGHDQASADATSADTAGHHHANGQTGCSVCASCCSAAALPVMPLVLASQDLAETATTVHSRPVAVFLTDGPERPPRTILA